MRGAGSAGTLIGLGLFLLLPVQPLEEAALLRGCVLLVAFLVHHLLLDAVARLQCLDDHLLPALLDYFLFLHHGAASGRRRGSTPNAANVPGVIPLHAGSVAIGTGERLGGPARTANVGAIIPIHASRLAIGSGKWLSGSHVSARIGGRSCGHGVGAAANVRAVVPGHAGCIAIGAGERLWRLIGGKCVSAASHAERQRKNKYWRSHSNSPQR